MSKRKLKEASKAVWTWGSKTSSQNILVHLLKSVKFHLCFPLLSSLFLPHRTSSSVASYSCWFSFSNSPENEYNGSHRFSHGDPRTHVLYTCGTSAAYMLHIWRQKVFQVSCYQAVLRQGWATWTLQILLDSNSHEPQLAWHRVRVDGNCSPTTSEEPQVPLSWILYRPSLLAGGAVG